MPRPSLLHRLTALLSSALLLQLSLVASGTLCRMHGNHSVPPAESMTAMATPHALHAADAGTRRAPGSMAPALIDDSSATPAGPCGMAGKSCDTPWAPGGCASMASCITAVSAIAAPAAAAPRTTSASVPVVASAKMPLGPAFAPELPPPRA